MTESLSLLKLYLEWGADETLVPLCTNHMENVKPTQTPSSTVSSITPTFNSPVSYLEQLNKACTLEEICQLIESFHGYNLHDTAMHSVLPKGNPHARFFIINEIPDTEEDRTGQVFAGQAGVWLEQLFDSIQIPLSDSLQVPLIPWRPPGGRPPSKTELQICLPFLYRILELFSPPLMISMGLQTARILTHSNAPISQLRGNWHTISLPSGKNIQLLPMRHPMQFDSSAKIRQEAWHDLLNFRSVYSEPS